VSWDRIERNWKQFYGRLHDQWGKITDDQLNVVAGNREHLAGRIEEAYGVTRKEAGKQLYEWQKQQKDVPTAAS
jgi:uncharacterized protein YjbJ (UPF0337 family)